MGTLSGLIMFKERLFLFLSSLPQHLTTFQHQTILRTILLYYFGRRNSSELRELARSLGIADELYRFKYEFLDRSYWMISVLWRVAFKYFDGMPHDRADGPVDVMIDADRVRQVVEKIPAITSSEIQACVDDMRLLEFLNLADHQRLFAKARSFRKGKNPGDFECPTDLDLVPIITKLRKFCRDIAARRLQFVTKYDASVHMSDLIDELFEAALITLRNYDHEYTNAVKVYNFARVGVKNHCVLMQQFHTRQRRGRIVKVMVNNQVEFTSTTTSLDQPLGGSSISLGDVISDESNDMDRQFAERQWLCNLLRKIPQDVGQVVKVTLGDHDPEFSTWLASQGAEIGNLSDTTLTRKACQFYNVPLKQVKTALRRTGQIAMAA